MTNNKHDLLLMKIYEKIGYVNQKVLYCRYLYNKFIILTHNTSFTKDTEEKKGMITKFLLQTEHDYVIRHHNLQKFADEYSK